MLKIILIGTVTILLVAGCQKTEAIETRPQVSTVPVVVGVHKATSHTFHRQIEITADILAHKQVTIISKVPGEVKKVLVAEGDKVKKGDLLVQLDKQDFKLALKQANAQLAAAKAGVTAAEIGLETVTAKHGRLARLRDKQVISESAYEDIEGTKRATNAQVSLAQAQVGLAQVGLEAARTNLRYTEIRAPFDGEVAKRFVDEGTRLNAMPPTPVAILVDDSKLKVVGALPEKDIPFVSAQNPVEVTMEALPDSTFKTVVDRVDPIVDPQSRTAGVQALLDPPDERLHPGMSARLTLDMGNRQSIAVPDDVIIRSEIENETGWVFVVKNNRVSKRKVSLGVREKDLREVVGGLTDGEMVVRGGQEKLKNGQQVKLEQTTGEKG